MYYIVMFSFLILFPCDVTALLGVKQRWLTTCYLQLKRQHYVTHYYLHDTKISHSSTSSFSSC